MQLQSRDARLIYLNIVFIIEKRSEVTILRKKCIKNVAFMVLFILIEIIFKIHFIIFRSFYDSMFLIIH